VGKSIGVLIPEFPGQTHNFFWRELEALRDAGASVSIFSTRRPPSGLQSTSWGEEAMKGTTYLYPVSLLSTLKLVADALSSPSRSIQCVRLLWDSLPTRTPGTSPLRMCILLGLGMHLGRACKARGINHVHVHSCADAANIAMFANAFFGMTYSLTLHNPLHVWGGNQKNKWRHAAFGIAITDWILLDAQRQLGSSLPARMLIAPMGVNVDVFQRKSAYRPATDGPTHIFSCARLNPAKGFTVLLEAVRLLRDAGKQVTLTIAGEDDDGGTGYRRVLEHLISELSLEKLVVLLGAVPEERVRSELEAAHVFVLASFEEPLGVAIMEAMSMEVPVVATRAGGVPSIITDQANGLLVPPSDAPSLADAINRISSDASLARNLSQNGRQRIAERFHHRLSARAMLENV
jgi:colanic acid/amylovoran biosynthesis glycosyltransferase